MKKWYWYRSQRNEIDRNTFERSRGTTIAIWRPGCSKLYKAASVLCKLSIIFTLPCGHLAFLGFHVVRGINFLLMACLLYAGLAWWIWVRDALWYSIRLILRIELGGSSKRERRGVSCWPMDSVIVWLCSTLHGNIWFHNIEVCRHLTFDTLSIIRYEVKGPSYKIFGAWGSSKATAWVVLAGGVFVVFG